MATAQTDHKTSQELVEKLSRLQLKLQHQHQQILKPQIICEDCADLTDEDWDDDDDEELSESSVSVATNNSNRPQLRRCISLTVPNCFLDEKEKIQEKRRPPFRKQDHIHQQSIRAMKT